MTDRERDTVCVDADGLVLEIDVAAAGAQEDASLAQIIASAVRAANDIAGPAQGSVTVIVDDDERIRQLNRLWRGQDKPTNVLSFPYPVGRPGRERYLGDIAISHETAVREAAAEHKSLRGHVAHLSVHGFLHLIGYDHESDTDADKMERLERRILERIGIPDPYGVREAEG